MHRDRTHIAVLCLDIDKFKEINEAADHSGGDQVLRDIGGRIQSTLRENDLIARLAGDEFAIALVDITNLGDVMAFMNRLVEALRRPLQVAGKEMLVTTSVGIALAPADGDTAATVLRHAGIALARAKGDGGQRMCFFEQSMDKALQRRRMVEHELRLALGREEFEVVYQPQYDLATERQCGSEALVRWHHPVHGKIAPGHFISVAEDTGLIVPLGEWVLRRACTDAAKWPEPLIVAVNLSPAQFRDGDIAETVAEVLKETGLPPERLELEITESLLINDTEEVLGKLNRLRQLGVAIAMDDFGTGYSSLSYLARFPFSKIKIDRQFIRNMTRDPAMRAIVKTIIALGKSLDVTITAEGVETRGAGGDAARVRLPAGAGLPLRLSRRRRDRREAGRQRDLDHGGAQQRRLEFFVELSLLGWRARREQPAHASGERGDLGVLLGRAANAGLGAPSHDRLLHRFGRVGGGRVLALCFRRRGAVKVTACVVGWRRRDWHWRRAAGLSGLASAFGVRRGRLGVRLRARPCLAPAWPAPAEPRSDPRSASASSSTATGASLGAIMLPGPGSVTIIGNSKRKADGVDDASINEKDRDGDALQVDHGSEAAKRCVYSAYAWNRN